jgi:Malectin domain
MYQASLTLLFIDIHTRHYYSDLCTIYPGIKVVHAQGQVPTGSNTWPEVCPLLTDFVKSPAASGWPTNPSVPVATNVRRFLESLLVATELLNPTVYQYCYDLETAQDRVFGLAVPTTSPRPTPPPVTGQPSSSATEFPTIAFPYRNTYEPVIRINCGYTSNYTDTVRGHVWNADTGFNTGKRYVASGADIPRALDPFIYKSDRWDPPGDLTLKYTVNVAPAATGFLIRLHFCELYFPNILSRIFDVMINGITVIEGLDVVGEAGGWFQPLVKEFVMLNAPSNKIEILFNKVLENPKYVPAHCPQESVLEEMHAHNLHTYFCFCFRFCLQD